MEGKIILGLSNSSHLAQELSRCVKQTFRRMKYFQLVQGTLLFLIRKEDTDIRSLLFQCLTIIQPFLDLHHDTWVVPCSSSSPGTWWDGRLCRQKLVERDCKALLWVESDPLPHLIGFISEWQKMPDVDGRSSCLASHSRIMLATLTGLLVRFLHFHRSLMWICEAINCRDTLSLLHSRRTPVVYIGITATLWR